MPVIDCHAHLEPRMLDLPAMLRKMDEAGVDRVALIPAMNDPLPDTPDAILAALRALLTSPLHCCGSWLNNRFMTEDGHLKLRGTIYRIHPRPDNETVARVIASYPERFLGWIFLNPRSTDDVVEELERWHRVPGFVGVKLHPHWHRYSIEDVFPIAERCEALRLPILIHLGFGESGRWQLLTDHYPKLRLVFAHLGIPHFMRMWDEVRANRNLWLDVSSPYVSERLVRRAAASLGPHKLLYGTDAPYGFHAADRSYDYRRIRSWVERLPCRASDIDRVLGENLAELWTDAR